MKNILIVNDEKMTGGVSILLEDILNNIDYKGNIDLLILHNNGTCLNKLPNNINVIYGTRFFEVIDLNIKQILKEKNIKLLFQKIYLVFLMKTGLIKNKIIKERKKILSKKYDVEIAFKDGFCGIFTAYGDSKTKIQWIHTDYSKKDYLKKYRNMFKKIFDKFDKFVAVSLPVKNNFSSIYGQKDKIVVINNYVDDKKIINLAKEKKVKLSDCKLNLISVGRLHYDKGFHVLLKVLKRLDDDNLLDDVHFTLIGDGLEFDNLMKLKKEYKLDSKVSLLGSKSNPFIYLKNADLFILSSFHESFGNVIIESLVLHVPVLAVEVATIYEILDEKNGLIVKNNIDALYNGLKSLILNQDKIKEYKKNLNSYKYPNEEILNEIKKLLG